ncbi:hypothetical protein ACF0HT_13505 (plasmid) [Staphylococcus xylosus]|uniref:hypothetical protein n=1 Tax=Staphylococcus xylosus TaxID=1288 RepID=UPI002DB8171B|nr:hypothetical protein [Staphylococcus xylosus]MEB8122957.1 hypothetical protein [Staphylococcus xylosus]
MRGKNDNLKTKKQKKKEEKQIIKAHLKAKFNYKIGYKVKALFQYLKLNLKNLFKKYHKPLMYILLLFSLLLFIASATNFVKGQNANNDLSKYEDKNAKLKSTFDDLQYNIRKDNKKIESASISSQTGVKRAKSVINKVFKGMYDYNNSSEYAENRKENLKLFKNPKDKKIDKIYSDDTDSDGNKQIDTLGLVSEMNDTKIYTESVSDTSKKVVPFKVIVSYTGHIENVSSDYATRTHYTTYKVDVDTSLNKITKIDKIGTVKEQNEILN